MILLIDAGNTRIKWGIQEQRQWVAEGALMHHEIALLKDIAGAHSGIGHVLCANVAGPSVATAISAALLGRAPAPQWLSASTQCCGVRNLYDHPAQLGADRWAALIGAHTIHPHYACLVVTAGTATTIDLLDETGSFQGGLILPGEDLMRRALADHTAQLPLAEGHYVATPRCSPDAIVSGCLNAQAGAIERMYRLIAQRPRALCLLNGGAAARIADVLTIPFTQIDNLVLKGLAVIATEQAGPEGA